MEYLIKALIFSHSVTPFHRKWFAIYRIVYGRI